MDRVLREARPSRPRPLRKGETDHERKTAVPNPAGEGAVHDDAGAQGISGRQVGSEAARQVQGRERPRLDVRDRAKSERAGAGRRDRVRENGEGAGHAGGRDRDLREVVQGVRRRIKRTPDAELDKTVKFFVAPKQMGDLRKMDVLWFMLMDQVHHRGQFTIYLRMADGKVPSIYGPSADEPWM